MEALAAAIYTQMQSLAAAAKFQWPLPDKGLKKRIHRIAAPTLIMWGEKDGLVPPVYAEEFRRAIRDARVVIMEHTGHMIMIEEPRRWASLVCDFLG
jgi:pimeloyl-ACP methyl ester carboxylesterase